MCAAMTLACVLRTVATLVVIAAAPPAIASVPSLQECLEGSDFIANAARARDYGVAREHFLDRLDADFEAVRAFPPTLRWFVHDRDDEAFLRSAAEGVFDAPTTPEAHRTAFLRACFDRQSV